MRLFTAAAAIVAGIGGTLGGGVAYQQVRQPAPVYAPAAGVEVPTVIAEYAPCKRPAVLVGDKCVTTNKIFRLPRMTPPPPVVQAPVRVVVVKKVTTSTRHGDDDDEHEHEEHDDD